MKSPVDDMSHEELDTNNQNRQQQLTPQTTNTNKPVTNSNQMTEEDGYLERQWLATGWPSLCFLPFCFLYLAGSKEAQFLVPDLGGMRSTIGIGLPHRPPRLQRLAGRYDSLMP